MKKSQSLPSSSALVAGSNEATLTKVSMMSLCQQTDYYFRLCKHHWASWLARECQQFLHVVLVSAGV